MDKSKKGGASPRLVIGKEKSNKCRRKKSDATERLFAIS
jgi:hypothetical protein